MAAQSDSSNAPDAQDIAGLIRAIEVYHNCTVKVTIDAAYDSAHSYLVVTVSAHAPQLVGKARHTVIKKYETMPGSQYKNLDVALFRLLHNLDEACGRCLWKQSALALP